MGPVSFFRSDATVDSIILKNLQRPPGAVSEDNKLFFPFPSGPPTESAFDDFASFFLGMLNYDKPERVVLQHLEIGFLMCGKRVDAKLGIVVLDEEDYIYILLVQEDKMRGS